MLSTLFPTRRFAWYTLTNGAAFVAAWMQRLALGWIIWELTHSGLWLGLLSICDLGPALLFGPIGGVLGDRGHPERVLAWGQAVTVAVTVATGIAVWLGVPPWFLLVLAVIGGAAVSIQDSARAAVVTGFVPAANLASAIALSAVVVNLARFIGPAIAGVIATFAGVVTVFPVAAVVGLGLVVFAMRVRPERVAGGEHSPFIRDIAQALAYVGRHRLIGLVLLNFLLACLFARPVYELVPGLVDKLFHRDIAGLSAMTTAIGLGAVVAGVILMRGRLADRLAVISCLGTIVGGLSALALPEMPGFIGALIAAAALGFGISTCGIASQIVVQSVAREGMRSRVLSLWAMIIRAAPALGALALGALADHMGFRIPLLLAGAAALVAGAGCWLALRRAPAESVD
jgi:MFS family permease